ncbi:type II toxin-antitoxin system toxin DNA ADP-ribosyl transferase DarT [Thermostichus sp. MS-CIW-25]
MPIPGSPEIYHITHVCNLQGIVTTGGLLSDAAILQQGGPTQAIGMSKIKQRRIKELEVSCHPGTKVGDYVPFYFCPRSIMLYVIHCANHPELTYRGGQTPIVHLEADLYRVIAWADHNGVRWAFSLSNAGARYAEFRSQPDCLGELDWNAIAARDFRDPDIKERKQAEFLVHRYFPLDLVERIGVCQASVKDRVNRALTGSKYNPAVEVHVDWYF